MTLVDEIVLTPMQIIFPPPVHLRGNPAGIKAALGVYREALEPFDAETLKQAWLKAASENRYRKWPECADILGAAGRIKKGRLGGTQKDDGVERMTAMEDAYTRRFMATTRAAARAREGGYEGELKGYVLAAAHVQAQHIQGRRRLGYDFYALFGKGPRDKEAEDEWFARQEEQAATGHIQVRVPLAMVEKWRGEAAGRGR